MYYLFLLPNWINLYNIFIRLLFSLLYSRNFCIILNNGKYVKMIMIFIVNWVLAFRKVVIEEVVKTIANTEYVQHWPLEDLDYFGVNDDISTVNGNNELPIRGNALLKIDLVSESSATYDPEYKLNCQAHLSHEKWMNAKNLSCIPVSLQAVKLDKITNFPVFRKSVGRSNVPYLISGRNDERINRLNSTAWFSTHETELADKLWWSMIYFFLLVNFYWEERLHNFQKITWVVAWNPIIHLISFSYRCPTETEVAHLFKKRNDEKYWEWVPSRGLGETRRT